MILLDTHAFVWLVSDPRKLSAAARRAIDHSDTLGIPAISCFEIAMLVQRSRLRFDRDVRIWIHQALALPKMDLLPLEPEISVRAAQLDWDHRDPADRIIVATAMAHRVPVVSKDERIRSCRHVSTIW